MKLNRPMRRTTPETIVALIDVVFFLLVFFMLIGRMDATSPFDVAPAHSRTGLEMPAGGATISVSAQGVLALDGTELDKSQTLERLQIQLQAEPNLLVRVNAHRDALLQELLPLVASVEALGARDVMLVVTPEEP
ncbi:ExbD/TolR family protein [Pseudopelagicola sp. nBUS_19]|uniref:ExbD/TolR family protein n=1 Tax=Pseudopelagicola sp. nBUS_19 TaxID=3395316 RepID=UPI003EB96484